MFCCSTQRASQSIAWLAPLHCRGRGQGGGDTQAVVSMEQALPLRADWLNFNRFRARAEHTIPMGPYRLLLCGKGAPLL